MLFFFFVGVFIIVEVVVDEEVFLIEVVDFFGDFNVGKVEVFDVLMVEEEVEVFVEEVGFLKIYLFIEFDLFKEGRVGFVVFEVFGEEEVLVV